MRPAITVMILAVLGPTIAACGKSSDSARRAGTASSAASSTESTQTPTSMILNFGHRANASDTKAAQALLRRYVAAAANNNPAAGCRMIVPSLAHALAEDYGRAPSLPYLKGGKNCRAILGKFFRHRHALYVTEHKGLEVVELRLNRYGGYAILNFPHIAKRAATISHEHGAWWLNAMGDTPLARPTG
jgi:hypothetical protein